MAGNNPGIFFDFDCPFSESLFDDFSGFLDPRVPSLGDLDFSFDAGSVPPMVDDVIIAEAAVPIREAAAEEPTRKKSCQSGKALAPESSGKAPTRQVRQDPGCPKGVKYFLDEVESSWLREPCHRPLCLEEPNVGEEDRNIWHMMSDEDVTVGFHTRISDEAYNLGCRQFPSVLCGYDLAKILYLGMFPSYIQIRVPDEHERVCSCFRKEDGWKAINYQYIVAGLRFPFPLFLRVVLAELKVSDEL